MRLPAASSEDRRQEPADVTRSESRQRASLVRDVMVGSPRFLVAPLLRHWHLRWGATDGEVDAAMPGDGVIVRPSFNATRAITVAAPPAEVWPWLVQIGFGRAGWYSYDLFDNAARPSAQQILPEFQQPALGDWVPMAARIDPATAFRITALEPEESMLWEKPNSTWAWQLTAMSDDRTRLVTRLRAVYDWRHAPGSALLSLVLLEFGDFPMMRKLLLGLKERCESERTRLVSMHSEATA
jgi:hypothetical protein